MIENYNIFRSFYSKFINSSDYLTFDNIPITIAICEFDSKFYSDSLAIQILGIDLFQKISNTVNTRKADFLAGRILAAHIIRVLGYNNVKVDIYNNRLPLWPERIKGSISHSNGVAICAASTCDSITRLGVDIELLNQEITSDLVNMVMSKDEILLVNSSKFNTAYMFSFFFSAKESLFKALYPEVNYYFNFDVAKIVDIDIDIEKMCFTVYLNYSLNSLHQKGMTYKGKYKITDTHIITIIY